jgi:branched-subunit amino acid transport protein
MRAELIMPMILATAALTYVLRYVPMVLARRLRARPAIERFIKTLPIGILAAIVVQSLFLRGGAIDAGIENHYLHGFVAALVIAALTRNLAVVVFGGIGVVAVLTFL